MTLPNPNPEELNQLITKFGKLSWPDIVLVEKIMLLLGIHEIVELEFTLNSRDPRERMAAMKMLSKYIPDLVSGEEHRYLDAKDTLMQIYYKVDETDEEALL